MDLSENELEVLPQARLKGLEMLTLLNLTKNHLTDVPIFGSDLRHLKNLDLSHNHISKIESFGHLGESVESLILNNNIISWLSNEAFQNFSSLKLLDLRHNFLTHLEVILFDSIEISIQKLFVTGKF